MPSIGGIEYGAGTQAAPKYVLALSIFICGHFEDVFHAIESSVCMCVFAFACLQVGNRCSYRKLMFYSAEENRRLLRCCSGSRKL